MTVHDKAFEELVEKIIIGDLQTATLSSPWKKTDEVLRITMRPLKIKDKLQYQLTNHYKSKVTHINMTPEAAGAFVKEKLPLCFQQGVFKTVTHSYHVLINKQMQMTVLKKTLQQSATPLPLMHNRSKNYTIPEGAPVPFLVELGIMNDQGKVFPKKYDKFKQINRFVELVSDVLVYLPIDRLIEIIDFGCGKAYLTFALYHYLKHVEKREVNITGLDLKQDVITHCQELADKLVYTGLKFAVGDINNHVHKGKVDLVITLHACDTATDAAIEKAVEWDAEVILCVPCCQHELYNQIASKPLETLLRHGILRERFAALVTDAARADLLTVKGYEVQVLEFIDMEHTPKNLLLRAVKSSSKERQRQAKERYLQFKESLLITPSLEKRFGLG